MKDMPEHKAGCLVCGRELEYIQGTEEVECNYCKRTFSSNVKCRDGHYICDQCHGKDALGIIEEYCLNSTSKDPIGMAVELMEHPAVKMHGPEHHFLVPAVLLTAYFNVTGQAGAKKKMLELATRRSAPVLGGFCGTHGNCGAAVGAGIFISLITGSTPLAKEEWRLSNLMTSRALRTIAEHGGPRCCKRTTFLAIMEAVSFVKECLRVEMGMRKDLECAFSPLNKECLLEDCPYHPKGR